MLVTVGLQTAVVLISVLIAWIASGSHSAWSLFLGGAAGVVPNALFALRLARHQGKSPESYPVVFFLGEFTKIFLTIAAFGLIIKFQPNSNWLAVMIGLIVGLKVQLFGLWFTGDRTDRVIREAEQKLAEQKELERAQRELEEFERQAATTSVAKREQFSGKSN
jgi:ATP synthase protein I